MKKILVLLSIVIFALLASACGGEKKVEKPKPSTAVFETNMGTFEVALATEGAPGTSDWLTMDSFLGKDGVPGWGGMALEAAQGLFDGYLGLQKLGMAKKALAENQRQFNLNYDAQRRTTNAALEDRQRARLASNPGAYESVGTYMDRNGVK